MKEYNIINIGQFCDYTFESENQQYYLNIEFYSKIKPEVNDILILNEDIFNKNSYNYCGMISLEFLTEYNEKYEKYMEKSSGEFAILIKDDKKYIFKRIYG